MQSKTKHRLTPSQIDGLVENAFGVKPTRVDEFHGGSMNAAYRIELADEGPVVLKVGSAPDAPLLTYERDALRSEINFYERASAALPLPQLLHHDLTRQLIASDYMFISVLNGSSWAELDAQIDPADGQRLTRDLGAAVGKLHSIHGDRFGYPQPGNPSGDTWHDAFLAMSDAVLDDILCWNVELPVSPDEIRSAVRTGGWSLRDVTQPSLLHFDLWKSNLFLSKDGGTWQLEGIIDCERSYWGDPLAELVSLKPMQDPIDKDFLEGYAETAEQPIELTPSAECRLTLYQLYLALLWVAEATPHGYLDGQAAEVAPVRQFYDGIGHKIADLVGEVQAARA